MNDDTIGYQDDYYDMINSHEEQRRYEHIEKLVKNDTQLGQINQNGQSSPSHSTPYRPKRANALNVEVRVSPSKSVVKTTPIKVEEP